MWNSKGIDHGGGGFSDFSSPEKQDKPAKRVQNIVPVTIRQILESSDDGFKIGGLDVHMFTLVALVRSIEITSTKVTYVLDDGTGGISAVFWLEINDNEEPLIPSVVKNTYCRIYGSVRISQNKRYVFVFRIMKLTSLNELTRHILEVIHTDLKIQKMSASKVLPEQQNTGSPSTSAVAEPSGFNAQQHLVYNAVMKCNRDIGEHKDEVIKAMAGKMSASEVSSVLDFLSNEGHIYTTIDDDHFRCTDS